MIKNKRPGFMLIELVIVVALITFIILLTCEFSFVKNRAFVQAELDKLYSCALYLQAQARLEKNTLYLKLDTLNQTYVADSKSHKLNKNVMFGLNGIAKGPPSRGVGNIGRAITFKDDQILFYPDGTISSGAIYLTDNTRSCLYALTCGISQISHLRKYKFDNKWITL